MMISPSASSKTIFACYFLSGCAALIYQVVWLREFTHVLGASLYASAAVIGLFLGGLGVGATIGSRIKSDRPLVVFACLQMAIAVIGAIVPWLCSLGVQEALGSQLPRLLLAALVILPVTSMMGATFPMLMRALRGIKDDQWLYGVNTVGGAVGCGLAGFVLLPALGLQGSTFVAVGLDLLAAALGWATHGVAPAARNESDAGGSDTAGATPRVAPDSSQTSPAPSVPAPLIFAAFAVGALSLVLETSAARLMMLVLGSSTYAASGVILSFILFLGIGALIVPAFLERYKQPLLLAAAASLIASIAVCVVTYLAGELPWTFASSMIWTTSVLGGNPFAAQILARILVCLAVCAVPALCCGAVLPQLFGAVNHQRSVSLLYAFNCLGSVCGAFATGFWIIPVLGAHTPSGIQTALIIASLGLAALSMFLFWRWTVGYITDGATRRIVNGVAAFFMVAAIADLAFFKPEWNQAIMSSGVGFYPTADLKKIDERSFLRAVGGTNVGGRTSQILPHIEFYRDGLNCTVTVERSPRSNVIFLKNDGKVEAALPLDQSQPSPTSDLDTHLALARLPLLAQDGRARDALIIGYGSGATTGGAMSDPSIQSITVAELEPAVLAAAPLFKHITGDPVHAGAPAGKQLTAVETDGRYHLATNAKTYDAMICQPSDPWVNGSAELYSLEFWKLARTRLTRDGVLAQWLPLYSISPKYLAVLCRTFLTAFPDAAIYVQAGAGECVLLGFNQPPSQAVLDRLKTSGSGVTIIGSSGIRSMGDRLGSKFGDNRINTDDNLVVEFAAASGALTQDQSIESNLEALKREGAGS